MPSDGAVIRMQREGGRTDCAAPFSGSVWWPSFLLCEGSVNPAVLLLVLYACQICFSDFSRGVFEGSLPFSPEKEEVIVCVCHRDSRVTAREGIFLAEDNAF